MLRLLCRFTHVRNIARFVRRHPQLAKIGGKTAFLTTTAWSLPIIARCMEDDSDGTLTTIDPEMLSHEFLIKQASIVAVEAASRVLIQLTAAILDAHEAYWKSLNKLSSLLKRFETEVGLCSGDDSIWLEMIAIREETNRLKADVLSLESRMQSVTGLMEAIAQTAFANGAEYAGICANERLLSSERQIRSAAQKTATLEDVLNKAHRDAVISGADKADAPEKKDLKKT
ncbi:diablo IAP-binding mitochondrial protein-like [Dermacentor albipictus]|uniref:diablo IAP-binding mitochondrial protein-like n=1 Tax=Dermacentor albipictus TaxID=60249 RepID=UPI0031FCC694